MEHFLFIRASGIDPNAMTISENIKEKPRCRTLSTKMKPKNLILSHKKTFGLSS